MMKNIDKVRTMTAEELAKLCQNRCKMCVCQEKYYCRNSCAEGIVEWLQQEHIEPMPEIKIGDVIYCNICKSRARFVVMSDIYAINLKGIFIRWREKNDIWKIERMNDGTGFLEVIWRADNE